jgi:hypothetical protein
MYTYTDGDCLKIAGTFFTISADSIELDKLPLQLGNLHASYKYESFNANTGWKDASGHAQDASIVGTVTSGITSGFGATRPIGHVSATAGSNGFTFPAGVVPDPATLCVVARYIDAHSPAAAAAAYTSVVKVHKGSVDYGFNPSLTFSPTNTRMVLRPVEDWAVICGEISSASSPTYVNVNGRSGTVDTTSVAGPYDLSVRGETGWAIAEIAIWSDKKSHTEIDALADTYLSYLSFGTHEWTELFVRPTAAYANVATAGAIQVTVAGMNFGEAGFTASTRFGGTACQSTNWTSDTAIMCQVPAGIASTKNMVVTVERQVGTLTQVFSYDSNVLKSVIRANVPATGSVMITVVGAAFGTSSYSSVLNVYGTAAETTVWVSDTSMLCRVSAGIMSTRAISVTAGVRVGTVTEIVTYDTPTATLTWPANTPMTAGDHLQAAPTHIISGANFGQTGVTANGILGGTTFEATMWMSDSSISPRFASGFFRTHTIAVTAGIMVGTLTESISYDTASLTRLSKVNFVSAGAQTAQIFGSHFGQNDYTFAARMAGTAGELTSWTSDSAVTIKTPAGSMRTHCISITGGVTVGTLTEALSYDAVSLSSVGMANLWTGGAVSVTVTGSQFGVMLHTLMSRVGGTASEATDWVSDTALLAKVARSIRKTHRVVITSGVVVGTLTEAVSYDAPSVSSIAVTNMVTVATQTLTMSGANFGRVSYTPWETALVRAVTGCRTRL